MKDTFYTVAYKGTYIHACRNLATGKDEFTIQGWPYIVIASLRAAKCRITRIIGKGIK